MALVGRTLAVDWGERRTGLAVCDALGIAIRTLPPVVTSQASDRLRGVLDAAAAEDAERVLIGLPLNMDGSEGSAAQKARAFAASLAEARADLELALWDERLTTVEAADLLAEAGVRRDRQRGRIDSASAAVLLRSWIDARRAESSLALESDDESSSSGAGFEPPQERDRRTRDVERSKSSARRKPPR